MDNELRYIVDAVYEIHRQILPTLPESAGSHGSWSKDLATITYSLPKRVVLVSKTLFLFDLYGFPTLCNFIGHGWVARTFLYKLPSSGEMCVSYLSVFNIPKQSRIFSTVFWLSICMWSGSRCCKVYRWAF